jgi:Protein of unknown function (DUF2911)
MKSFFLSLLLFAGMFCVAQDSTIQGTDVRLLPLDKSPMDMAYFPDEYPVLKIKDKIKDPPLARVIYGRPQKAGRVVFGDLVEYGKVWRLGANEATEIEFYKDVKIDGKKIPKGKYTLYALVNPDQWTLIVNKDTDTWGAFKYDEKKDLLRVNVPVEKEAEPVEAFTMYFDRTPSGANLEMAWDNVKATLPIGMK